MSRAARRETRAWTRRWTATVLSLALACGLACAGVAGGAPAAPGVVALGDSYSSGEASPPWDPGTNVFRFGVRRNGCHRSAKAWPRQLGASREHHLACSGALVAHLYRGKERQGPDAGAGQIERLKALAAIAPPTLVTITIGGNDVGFKRIVRQCFLYSCLRDVETVEIPAVRDLRPRLARAYVDVRAAARGARVLVVGYPDILPAADEPDRCLWLGEGEKRRLGRLAQALETTIADSARLAGVEYLSARDVLDGHELCTGDSWLYPVGSLRASPFDQQQAHPREPGQRAIAVAAAHYLARHPVPAAPSSEGTRTLRSARTR